MKQIEVKNLLEKYHLNINKQLGQNFLIDQNIIEKIVNLIDKSNTVVEIGPGLGSLTREIIKRVPTLLCYEIDKGFVNLLEQEIISSSFHIIHQDVLKVNFTNDFNTYCINNPIIVANLPYYITSAVIVKLIEDILPNTMILMMQKEVASRFTGKTNTKDYNSLSVLLQYYMDVKYLFDVPPQSFYPMPKVNSSVLLFQKKEQRIPVLNESFFLAFNRIIFSQRRKTIVNNIAYQPILGKTFTKEMIEKVLTLQQLSLTIRAEALSVEEIIRLSDAFFQI